MLNIYLISSIKAKMKNLICLILVLIFSVSTFAIGVDRNIQTTIQNFIPITTVQRDALPSPQQGDFIWNITNGTLNFYNAGWFDVASMTPAQVTEATQYADATQNGLLSLTDWSTFNDKVSKSSLVTQIIYVDPVNGSDVPADGRGSTQFPYQTIQAAFDSVPAATTINQWANDRIDIYLLQGEYNESPVVFYKRRSINIIGDGAKVLLDFTLNYDPTAQYTGFVYDKLNLPAPWTGGFASPTLSIGCVNNMNGIESGFTTNCMQFMGRLKFLSPNYATQAIYGTSYMTFNGVESRGGLQMNNLGGSANGTFTTEIMNSVISGNNIGLTKIVGGGSFSLKSSNSRITSVIGPNVVILKIDSNRIGRLDRTTDEDGVTGVVTNGAIQFNNTTSYSGITNSTFVGTGTQYIGNATGTASSVMKIDKMSWYGLRALTLDFGGGVTWNITDAEKYLRVVATDAGSSEINATTDHLLLDPASLLSAYTITMPANPFDSQRVLISSGAFGVTSLSLLPNAGQTFEAGSVISTLPANSAYEYEWNKPLNNWFKIRDAGSSSIGDVVGPASSVDGEIAVFDLTTGKLIKSAIGTGVAHLTSGVLSVSNVDLASEVTGILPTVNGGTNVSSAGALGNILTSDGTNWISAAPASGGDVVGPASSVDGEIAVFDLTTGKLIKSATGTGVAHLTSGVLSVSNVDLASEVTGVLPTANGGTNVSSAGAIGNVLTSDGTNWISSAIPLSIESLNSLTATQQLFATSTTGTDFTISSSVDTHTFNLPVADATNTGKLSNADWSLFNSKVDGPVSSVDGEIAVFDLTTGKLIKSATGTGIAHLTSGVLSVSNVDLTSEVTGILPPANGGTGLSAVGAIGNILTSDGTNWISSAPASGGDVVGPSSSVDGEVAVFDLTTGKLIKSAIGTGVAHLTSGVLSVSNIDLASEVTGILPPVNGGTGISSPSTIYKVLTSDGTNWISDFVDYANVTNTPTNLSDFTNDVGYITSSLPTIFGSRATPRNIQSAGITVASSDMSNSATSQDIYVCGSSTGASCDSAITLTTIDAGTIDGQRMCIIGRDNTNTVTLDGGTTTNIEINGNAVLGAGKTICLRYDLTNWSEVSRNF